MKPKIFLFETFLEKIFEGWKLRHKLANDQRYWLITKPKYLISFCSHVDFSAKRWIKIIKSFLVLNDLDQSPGWLLCFATKHSKHRSDPKIIKHPLQPRILVKTTNDCLISTEVRQTNRTLYSHVLCSFRHYSA